MPDVREKNTFLVFFNSPKQTALTSPTVPNSTFVRNRNRALSDVSYLKTANTAQSPLITPMSPPAPANISKIWNIPEENEEEDQCELFLGELQSTRNSYDVYDSENEDFSSYTLNTVLQQCAPHILTPPLSTPQTGVKEEKDSFLGVNFDERNDYTLPLRIPLKNSEEEKSLEEEEDCPMSYSKALMKSYKKEDTGTEATVSDEKYSPRQQVSKRQRNRKTKKKRHEREDEWKKSETEVENQTTVMLRNIPNKYTQDMLVNQMSEKGLTNSYDFLYLPIDFKNRCNMGYAFINFRNESLYSDFIKAFEGYHLPGFRSKKVCSITPARVQGLNLNIDHFRNSPVMAQLDSSCKPLLLSADGTKLPFPEPNCARRRSKDDFYDRSYYKYKDYNGSGKEYNKDYKDYEYKDYDYSKEYDEYKDYQKEYYYSKPKKTWKKN